MYQQSLKFRNIILLLCSAIFLSISIHINTAYAQSPETCLNIGDVLKLSVGTDPAIGVALGEKEQSEARLKQIKADWLPQVSGYSRTARGDVGLVDGRTDNQIGVIISQRLYDFGKNKTERKAANASVLSADYALQNVELGTAQTATMSFIRVLEAKAKLKSAQERESHLEDIAGTISRRLEVGTLTRAEARSIEAEYAGAKSLRIEYALDVRAAQSKLYILTGMKRPLCQDMNVLDASFKANMPVSLERAIEIANLQSPSINTMKADLTSAEANVALAKKNQLPTVSAQGVSAYIYDDFRNKWNRRERIGVEVNMPFWGGGRYNAQRSEAKAKLRTSNMELNLIRRKIEQKVSLSWYKIQAYKELSDSRKQATRSYRAEAQAIHREFEVGLRTYQDVEKVDADLEDAVLREIEAQYSLRYEYLIILAVMNKLSDDNLIKIIQ